MASKVVSCGYDPRGKKDFERINPVTPLQTDGDLDISYLVQEIVTKDFGYSGTSKYTLRLKNHKMVLELWHNTSGTDKQKYAKIKLEEGQWKRIDSSSNVTVLNNPQQAQSRLNATLSKIRDAYLRGQPEDLAARNPSAQVQASEGDSRVPVIVKNKIKCNHPVCNHSIDMLQGQLQQQLSALGQRLSDLERSIERHQQLRPAQCCQHVDRVQETVESLREKLDKLQQSIDKLQRENAVMKGLRQPLEAMSRDVPEELREIKCGLEQIKILLGDRLSVRSDSAQSQMIREMQDNLSRMQAQLAPLAESFATLTNANSGLLRENEALKRQAATQELLLKNREVEDLQEKNHAQEEILLKLQTELDQEKAKHSQLQKLSRAALAENQRVQRGSRATNEDLNGQLGKLQEAQGKSAQALSEKEQQVEELKRQLAASKEQNETIDQLRQQLAQTNTELAAAQQENSDRQRELDAARKTNSGAQEQLEALRVELTQNKEHQQWSVIELQQIRQKADELEAALAVANQASLDEKNCLERELSASKSELRKVTARFEADGKNHAALQEEARKTGAKLQEQINNLQAELAQSQNAQQISKQSLAKAEGKVEHLEGELTASRNRAEELERNNAAERQHLDQELTKLRSQLESAEKTNGASQATIEKLRESLQQKVRELEKQKRAAAAAQETAQKVQTETNALRGEFEDQRSCLDNKIKALEAQLLSLEGKVDPAPLQKEHQAEIERLQQQIEAAKLQQKEAAQELQKRTAALKTAQQKITELEQLLVEKAVVEQQMKEQKAQCEKLNHTVLTLEKQIEEQTKKSISDGLLQKLLDETRKQLNSAEKARLEAEGKNTLLEQNNQTLRQEIDRLGQEIDRLEKEIQKLKEKPQNDLRSLPSLSQNEHAPSESSFTMEVPDVLQSALNAKQIACQKSWATALAVNFALIDYEDSAILSNKLDNARVSSWCDQKKFDSSFKDVLDQSVILNQLITRKIGSQYDNKGINENIGRLKTVLEQIKKTLNFDNVKSLKDLFGKTNKAFLAQSLIKYEHELTTLLGHLIGKALTIEQKRTVTRAKNTLDWIRSIKSSIVELQKVSIVVEG